MNTVKTKFLQAKGLKGERLSVNIDGQTKIYPYEYALNGFENHVKAIYKAIKDLNLGVKNDYAIFKATKNDNYTSNSNGYLFNL